MNSENVELAKSAMMSLLADKKWKKAIKLYESLQNSLKEVPRIILYYAIALCEAGDLDLSEKLIYKDGKVLEIPDIKEGELALNELWIKIQKKRAELKGKPFDEKDAVVPFEINFSMAGN